ncbi:protein LRATD2-like [Saccoglossus kowalevskii]
MGNVNLHSLKAGDVLTIHGMAGHNTLPHWGVYIGNGDIVHFTRREIRRDALKQLCKSKSINVKVHNCHDDHYQPKDSNDVIISAEDQVGTECTQNRWMSCKEFACWCRYGDVIPNKMELQTEDRVLCFEINDEGTDTRLLHDSAN